MDRRRARQAGGNGRSTSPPPEERAEEESGEGLLLDRPPPLPVEPSEPRLAQVLPLRCESSSGGSGDRMASSSEAASRSSSSSLLPFARDFPLEPAVRPFGRAVVVVVAVISLRCRGPLEGTEVSASTTSHEEEESEWGGE